MRPTSGTAQAVPNSYYCVEDILALRDSRVRPEEILDAGARGLQFFDRFHDLASRLGFEERMLTSYEDAYRAEAGIDFEALVRDASDMAAAVGRFGRRDRDAGRTWRRIFLQCGMFPAWVAVVDQAFAARREARSDADSGATVDHAGRRIRADGSNGFGRQGFSRVAGLGPGDDRRSGCGGDRPADSRRFRRSWCGAMAGHGFSFGVSGYSRRIRQGVCGVARVRLVMLLTPRPSG